jgi:hypothetical protein
MFDFFLARSLLAAARARRCSAAARHQKQHGALMSIINETSRSSPPARRNEWFAGGLMRLVIVAIVSATAAISFTSRALACACGCSVFDVGGLGMPQEQEHGGNVFFEFWSGDQTQNWIGSSKGPAAANQDKEVNSQWYNVGFNYTFSRDWGVMVRVPIVNRDFTTDTGAPLGIQTFNSRDIGDIDVMAVYTGFFSDMSTGVMFGLKLPSGPYTAPGLDRDTQIGSGSTDLLLGAFHRGMLSGDNAWQYFEQFLWHQPFLYRSAIDPDSGLDELYKPGMQIDGAAGIVYNNLYHVLGLDKITPLAQLIISHREADSGPAADPLNSGFDRIMISPGVEFTKVVDEANKRVVKLYADVEVPIYYRTNAANNAGTEGQLIAPYLIKVLASYNF